MCDGPRGAGLSTGESTVRPADAEGLAAAGGAGGVVQLKAVMVVCGGGGRREIVRHVM